MFGNLWIFVAIFAAIAAATFSGKTLADKHHKLEIERKAQDQDKK